MRKRLFTYILAAALLLTLIPFGAVHAEAASDFVASAELVEVIKKWEGFCAKPIWDYGQWSVGYGTRAPDEHLARYRAEGISEEEATDAVCARIPRRLHNIAEELITEWWRQPMRPVDGMAELIAQLKCKGYGIYLLSNAGLPLRQYFRWIPGASYFDGLMVSAEEKMLKPHYEIYHALFERFSLKPEECFFIDDNPVNIEGAACCGMAGTVFKGDITRLKRELLDAGLWLM